MQSTLEQRRSCSKGEDVKNKQDFKLPMSDVVFDLLVARRARGIIGEFVFPANSKSGHIEEPKDAFGAIEEETGIKASPHDLEKDIRNSRGVMRSFALLPEGADQPQAAPKSHRMTSRAAM